MLPWISILRHSLFPRVSTLRLSRFPQISTLRLWLFSPDLYFASLTVFLPFSPDTYYTCIHTNIHTYKHTYTHTCMHKSIHVPRYHHSPHATDPWPVAGPGGMRVALTIIFAAQAQATSYTGSAITDKRWKPSLGSLNKYLGSTLV